MNLVGRKFNNDRLGISICVYDIDGKKWFIGKDIASELGYTDATQAVTKSVSEHRKKKMYVATLENIENCPTDSSEIRTINNNLLLINESGLYQLAIKSTKSEAIQFQDWICDDVLPSLRENNYYIDKQNITEEQINNMRECLYDLCDMGKIAITKASKMIFKNKNELKKIFIKRGWLDYKSQTYQQQRLKGTDGYEFDLFVIDTKGTYENGKTTKKMQVSISNAGYVWLKEKFRNSNL